LALIDQDTETTHKSFSIFKGNIRGSMYIYNIYILSFNIIVRLLDTFPQFWKW